MSKNLHTTAAYGRFSFWRVAMTIILTTEELERVTGYKTPKRQVKELPKQ